jgi:hypothetical protein
MQGNDAAFEARRCCFAGYANVTGGAHGTLALDDTQSSAPVLTFHLLSGRASVS